MYCPDTNNNIWCRSIQAAHAILLLRICRLLLWHRVKNKQKKQHISHFTDSLLAGWWVIGSFPTFPGQDILDFHRRSAEEASHPGPCHTPRRGGTEPDGGVSTEYLHNPDGQKHAERAHYKPANKKNSEYRYIVTILWQQCWDEGQGYAEWQQHRDGKWLPFPRLQRNEELHHVD